MKNLLLRYAITLVSALALSRRKDTKSPPTGTLAASQTNYFAGRYSAQILLPSGSRR